MADGDFTPASNEPEFRLRDLRPGQPDPRGRIVRDVLWAVSEFRIYKTDYGINPMFSDDPAEAKTQRENYLGMGSRIADFNHLISILKPKINPFTQNEMPTGVAKMNTLVQVERELARCIAQALLGDPEGAKTSLAEIRERLAGQIRNRARVVHLLINVFLVICAVAGAMWFVASDYKSLFEFNTKEFGLAVMMGSVGALFSTTVRLQSMEVDPTVSQYMHWVYALQRVLVGAIGALVIYFGFKSGVVNGLFQPVSGAVNLGEPFNPYWLSFVCMLAGFSERLVPNLLDSQAAAAERASGTVPD